MFNRYFINESDFSSLKVLFFTFSSRRRQRRRQQYEGFQQIFSETSLSIANIYHFIISIQSNQTFQRIDSHHSTFTFWSHSRRNSSGSLSIDIYSLLLMVQDCRLYFSPSKETIPRFRAQFPPFAKPETLEREDFEVDDDRVSSVSMSFLTVWLVWLPLASFFSLPPLFDSFTGQLFDYQPIINRSPTDQFH